MFFVVVVVVFVGFLFVCLLFLYCVVVLFCILYP